MSPSRAPSAVSPPASASRTWTRKRARTLPTPRWTPCTRTVSGAYWGGGGGEWVEGQARLGHPGGCVEVLVPKHPLAVLLSGLGARTALEHPWSHPCMWVGEMEGVQPKELGQPGASPEHPRSIPGYPQSIPAHGWRR